VQPAGRQEAPGETSAPPAGQPAAGPGGGTQVPSDASPAAQPVTVTRARGLAATGGSVVPALAGVAMIGAAYAVWRRRTATQA
jgi:hypothetical protein